MKKAFIYAVIGMILLGATSTVAVAGEREDLIKVATQEIIDLAFPYTHFHQVQYDQEIVIVKFITGKGYEWKLNQYYLLWWDCQFVALNAFVNRGLTVNEVGVITNLEDGSGLFLMLTKAPYIKKYANAAYGMSRWLDLTNSYIWKNEKWNLVGK